MTSGHIVLLGDSIFDNAAYTRGEPDVATHLARMLPGEWQSTLCAVDGATTAGLASQLTRVPNTSTHLVVSIGGNDALGNVGLLSRRVSSTAAALELFAEAVDRFAADYAAALDGVIALRKPTVVCTIYNGRLEPDIATAARIALAPFNDVIQRAANARGVHVIELRSVCDDPSDYANPIEPSGRGGGKIARAIVTAIVQGR